MLQTDVTQKQSKKKLIIIVSLVLVLITSAVITYFLASNNTIANLIEAFKTEVEYTLKLDEFVINLRSETNSISRHFLKTKIAIMYTDKKQAEKIISSESKIRDIINGELRAKSYEEILDYKTTEALKSELKSKINEALKDEIVKEVYITDIVIQ